MPDLYYQRGGVRIFHGNSLEVLPELDTQFTACITDPPYGLAFMGKSWDDFEPLEYQSWCQSVGEAVLQALLPGAPAFVFGGTRTAHRLTCGLEDAGLTIKDRLAWMYAEGFPKSHDISKAIPATEEAEAWDGMGTAFAPSHEPIIYATRPREGTYAENALTHGVAGLNIDAGRIDTDDRIELDYTRATEMRNVSPTNKGDSVKYQTHDKGRWPANAVLDERASVLLDRQTGARPAGGDISTDAPTKDGFSGVAYGEQKGRDAWDSYDDSGGASRFFYTAKASASDRTAGMPEGADNPHPTVKPTGLIGWLVRLATYPERNHILDPFAGSGTLGYVCAEMGVKATLIEQDEESCELCAKRLQGQQALWNQ